MDDNQNSRGPRDERQSDQALARIQHSRADHDIPDATPEDKAAIVADPRNRLADGEVDPVTDELKPQGK